mmetsp:Transcript_36553/g.85051  ORF Transcript_36553/g.85051 Transcript_36553/m.85051 type:complete len:91 (-) Transcript_36553:94-366(-)
MIRNWFPSGVTVESARDPGVTGNFEVTVNGQLIHSKRSRGQGFLDQASQQRQQEVKQAISDAMQGKAVDVPAASASGPSRSGKKGGCSVM